MIQAREHVRGPKLAPSMPRFFAWRLRCDSRPVGAILPRVRERPPARRGGFRPLRPRQHRHRWDLAVGTRRS